MTNVKKVSFGELRAWSFEKYGKIDTIHEQMTVGQFVSYLFSTEHLTAITLRKAHKSRMRTTIEHLEDLPIGALSKEVLNDAFSKLGAKREFVKVYRNSFKRIVLKRAVELNMLDKNYDDYFMQRNLENHEKTRDSIAPENRTVGWYVCERCRGDIAQGKGSFSHASVHTTLKQTYYHVWHRKMKDFSLGWIGSPKPGRIGELRGPIELAISDGTLEDTEIFETQEKSLISINSDEWEIKDSSRKITKLNFSTLNDRPLEKKAMKTWMKDRVEKKLKGHAKYKNLVEKHFLQYLKDNNIALEKFTNTHKKKWISFLKKSILQGDQKCGTIRNALSCTKQFVVFLQESESNILKKDITWSKDKDHVKCDTKKKEVYPSWELKAIMDAINNDKDRLFSLTFSLIMMSARRLEEILSLKRNCVVDIAGVKCLRYTNHKLNREETAVLPSHGAKAEITLFKKSSGKQIVKTIETLKEMTEDLARQAPKRYQDNLLLLKSLIRNSLGYNIVPLLKSTYYSRLYDFKKRNRIAFKLEAHKFRHTIATAVIHSGKGIESAATILGNKPKTVARYYEADISKEETLRLGTSVALDVRKDAEKLINNRAPEVFDSIPEGSFSATVPGGICKSGPEAMRGCKYYNRLFGSGGCLGCSQLAVTEENTFYYKDLKLRVAEEFEQTRGTPFASSTKAKLNLVTKTLKNIENKGESN